jgi:hypothetical protein
MYAAAIGEQERTLALNGESLPEDEFPSELRGKPLPAERAPMPAYVLQFHGDNTAMISVCKSGKNTTMRHLGRTHGISITWLHDETSKPSCNLSYIATKYMAADIFTKFYPGDKHVTWNAVRRLINVLDPEEQQSMIGFSGEGWRCQHVRSEGKAMVLHASTGESLSVRPQSFVGESLSVRPQSFVGESLSVWPRSRKIGDKMRRRVSAKLRHLITSEHSPHELSTGIYCSLPQHYNGRIVWARTISGEVTVPSDISEAYLLNPHRVESLAYTPDGAPPIRVAKYSRMVVSGGTRISSGKRVLVLVTFDTPLDLISFEQSSAAVYP